MAFKITVIRGEPISAIIEVVEGASDVIGATVTAALKKASKTGQPSESAPVIAEFDVQYTSSVGSGLGPGWVLTTDSEPLSPGDYWADAMVELSDGFIDYTEPLQIVVKGRITPRSAP